MMERPSAIFVADLRALDFLNSIATPVDTVVDWIDSGDGLLSWLGQADLVPAEIIEKMKAQALPGELDKVAEQARSLREWFRAFVRARKDSTQDAGLADLMPLNRLLARDSGFSQIVPHHHGHGLELRTMRRWDSPESLLLPICEALARFICEEDLVDVKACEGATCTLMFADRTRRRARRWCSMSVCGNRAKQAAHRDRLRAHQ